MIRFAHFLGWWGVGLLAFVAVWSALCYAAKRRGDRLRDARELRRAAWREEYRALDHEKGNNGEE